MSIIIKPIVDHEKYMVNEHLVYRDRLWNWSCKDDLSNKELQAFKLYEKLIIKNSRIKKHIKAVYNINNVKNRS
ncbi:hypothetical protein OA88_19680 [Flavobacterium sp. JRM]|jgi:hypothetical protein|nr:hypothetical protein OA88_19680 [Flavobacterium sp. JRM]